jgi:large subunit ribosomal protein L17
MRHGDKVNNLGRTHAHRKALLANLASSLILHKRIQTTLAKAKELRKFIEPLATKSKNDTTHSRRVVFSELKDKYAVTELFREIAPKIADRPGGYTRILKLGTRQGDATEMALIEFVDFNEFGYTQAKESGRRRRRGGKGSAAQQPKTDAPKAKAAVEAPVTEAAVTDTTIETLTTEPLPSAEATTETEPAVEEPVVVAEASETAEPVAESAATEPPAAASEDQPAEATANEGEQPTV